MTVAYDGSGFHGFAPNPGVPTVAGALGDAIATVVRRPVELTGAGRTDAGVHAWGQVVSADLPADIDLEDLVRRLNKLLAPADRRARRLLGGPRLRRPLLGGLAALPLRRVERADAEPAPRRSGVVRAAAPGRWAMQAACDPLIGEHDFASFCRRPKVDDGDPEPSLVRRVSSARWSTLDDDEHHLRFEIRANAFCHQMVRSIVGTLVDIGLGKASPGDVRGILVARDREAAGQVAPPYGLTLWEVGYPPNCP